MDRLAVWMPSLCEGNKLAHHVLIAVKQEKSAVAPPTPIVRVDAAGQPTLPFRNLLALSALASGVVVIDKGRSVLLAVLVEGRQINTWLDRGRLQRGHVILH